MKATMMERAKDLRRKRIEANKKEVQALYYQRFRENCDDLRTIGSDNLKANVQAERRTQLRIKEEHKVNHHKLRCVFLKLKQNKKRNAFD